MTGLVGREISRQIKMKISKDTAKVNAENSQQKIKLEIINNGYKKSQSHIDKQTLIDYFKKQNIVITKKIELENGTFKNWRFINRL
jgi:hypothetical protein